MTRRLFLFASGLLALMTIALGSIGATATASAQDTCCARIENTANCAVTICAVHPAVTGPCVTVNGHSRDILRYRCDASTDLAVSDGCGQIRRIPLNGCIRVRLVGGCCADVCLTLSHDGCYDVTVTPVAIGICPCP